MQQVCFFCFINHIYSKAAADGEWIPPAAAFKKANGNDLQKWKNRGCQGKKIVIH
jgi:hypothetical protein